MNDPQKAQGMGCAVLLVIVCVVGALSTKSCQGPGIPPLQARPHVNKASVAIQRGKFEDGIKHCDEAIKIDPKYAEAYSWRCIARAWTGDTKAAIDDGDKAVQLEPDAFENWARRAVAKYANGDFHTSGEDWQKVLEMVSGINADLDFVPNRGMEYATANALAGWGAAMLGEKEIRGAVDAVAKALKIQPNYDFSIWGKLRPELKDAYDEMVQEIKAAQ
jgi:tetratricopeptide (TPR) repeat protein